MDQPQSGGLPPHEQPVFGVGIFGFTPAERKLLESHLGARGDRPDWRICAFSEADAWWINGENVRVLADGNLRVAAGMPSEKALRLDLPAIDRPIAFATPLAADFDPQLKFDPHSTASVEGLLLQFDIWLWQPRAQFALGAHVVKAIEQLRAGIFHVSHEGRLLAVVDLMQGNAAVRPRAHPEALWQAKWDRRPIGAQHAPESFVRTSLAELAWTYVQRTERDMLPARYRQGTIYYRRVPRVPLRMLRDSQLLILVELSASSATLDELERRTRLPRPRIESDLACLYYAGAITSKRSNGAPPGQVFRGANAASKLSEFDPEAMWDSTQAAPPESTRTPEAAPTAPVMLQREGFSKVSL